MPEDPKQVPPTTMLFTCPQCHNPVRASDTTCRTCGVNLALAAVFSERYTLLSKPIKNTSPTDLPRFGEYLVSRHYITANQLQAALQHQRELRARGGRQTLGQTLVEMGLLTAEQIEVASIAQMQNLQTALENSNRELEERVSERTAELEKALNRLTELEELKAAFVTNISHELRTPLVPIKGYASLLLSESLGTLNDTQKEGIQAMVRSVTRLEELVNELLQFASSLKGQMVITPTIFSLSDFADRLTDYFTGKAASAQVFLHLDIPESLPVVKGDAEKIYWVVFQLIDNAIKFNRPGGHVALLTEKRDAALWIAVVDTGPGIPAEKIPLIFQAFQHGTGDAGEQLFEGAGLGLALVKRIIEAHNSKVQVVSELGHGSVFAFELPMLKP